MGQTPASNGRRQDAGWYEIGIQGRLEPRWAGWFDGLTLSYGSDGTTLIRGPVVDQAALHGLLHKVRDLGLPLVSLTRIEPDRTDVPTHHTTTQHKETT